MLLTHEARFFNCQNLDAPIGRNLKLVFEPQQLTRKWSMIPMNKFDWHLQQLGRNGRWNWNRQIRASPRKIDSCFHAQFDPPKHLIFRAGRPKSAAGKANLGRVAPLKSKEAQLTEEMTGHAGSHGYLPKRTAYTAFYWDFHGFSNFRLNSDV